MTIEYGARVHYPDAADVERITNAVLNEARQGGVPAMPTKGGARFLAGEIKRRLSAEIRVEVDLVITGATSDAGPTPPPAPMLLLNPGDQIHFRGSLLQPF